MPLNIFEASNTLENTVYPRRILRSICIVTQPFELTPSRSTTPMLTQSLQDTPSLERHRLDDEHSIFSTDLPDHLRLNRSQFDEVWNMHPVAYTEIMMHGKKVMTPRWQQAYGRDYLYSGQSNRALPIPPLLLPLLEWSQSIHPKLNGLLLNWYDGSKGHYIGKHRDSIANIIPDTPIVTISFGETRTFRLRPHGGTGIIDFESYDSKVFIMPLSTNRAWTHEITKTARAQGKRISVTVRSFLP